MFIVADLVSLSATITAAVYMGTQNKANVSLISVLVVILYQNDSVVWKKCQCSYHLTNFVSEDIWNCIVRPKYLNPVQLSYSFNFNLIW